jgi:4-carboxymuconolactone decarboxylase
MSSALVLLDDPQANRTAHEPIGRKAGLTSKHLAVIRDDSTVLADNADPAQSLSDLQRAALVYTDWMTRNVRVPQRIFDALKAHLDDKQIVEATMTIAAYNMVSRFLVALDVADMAEAKIPAVVADEE